MKKILYIFLILFLILLIKNKEVRKSNGLIKIEKDASRKRIDPVDSLLAAFKLAQYYEFVFDYNKYSDLVESIYE